ncbi:MAG: VWA domain-containing protein, partial [Blastocatellia bacterium]|nr:VWA domain-containing protein [Blastocatellia bacterium]
GRASFAGLIYYQLVLFQIAQVVLKLLEEIAASVGELPGRKIVIYVSEKLPLRLSNKYLEPAYDTSSRPFENFSAELQRIISSSRKGGMTFYPLDPRGLATTIPSGSAADANPSLLGSLGVSSGTREYSDPLRARPDLDNLEHSRQGMRQLAAATGGFPVFNHNDMRVGLQRVLRDNEAYYMLAYYPSSVEAGKFRRIRVQLKDRSGLIVRTRSGYIAPKEKEVRQEPMSKQERISEALASMIPLTAVKVSVQTKADEAGEHGRVARLIVSVDAASVAFKQKEEKMLASLEAIVFAYNLRGELVNGFSNTLNLDLAPNSYSQVLRSGINMGGSIRLDKAGLYNIRVVVIDRETGRIGTASEWVEAE